MIEQLIERYQQLTNIYPQAPNDLVGDFGWYMRVDHLIPEIPCDGVVHVYMNLRNDISSDSNIHFVVLCDGFAILEDGNFTFSETYE